MSYAREITAYNWPEVIVELWTERDTAAARGDPAKAADAERRFEQVCGLLPTSQLVRTMDDARKLYAERTDRAT